MTKNLIKSFLLISITIFFISCGTSSTPEPTTNVAKADIKAVFDVPSLIGKSIDEVRKSLGKPTDKDKEPTKLQMKMNVATWDNSFEKEGHTLLVTFNPQNRKVTDFFIETSTLTSDYSDLLQLCNVTNDNPNYSIEPVPALKDNTKYTGIKIVAK